MRKNSKRSWAARTRTAGLTFSLTLTLGLAASTARAAGITRIEESDPAVTYSGSWTFRDPTGLRHHWSGGTAESAYEAGATATLTFQGTGVTWIGFRNDRTGIARVYVDGSLVAVVDTAGPSPTPTGVYQVPMYTIQGMAAGTHTITIEVTGDYNRIISGGAWVIVDAFDVAS